VPGSPVSRCRVPANRRADYLPGTIPTNIFHDTGKIGISYDLAPGKARFVGIFRCMPPHPPRDVLSERFLRYSLRHKGVTPMGAFGRAMAKERALARFDVATAITTTPLTPDCARVLRPPGLSNGERDFASGSLADP